LKQEIKEITIGYAKNKAKTKKNILTSLEQELVLYNAILNPSEEQKQQIEYLENKINGFYLEKAKGAQIRARIDYIEENEENLRLFKTLENSRQTKKNISSITINNKRITNNEEILKHEVEFYDTLYKSENMDGYEIPEYLNSIQNAPKLKDNLAKQCEGNLTESECYTALFGMKNNKSPGSDGLTVEFYQIFWRELKQLLIDSLNYGFTKQEMSCSQKYSIITLLFKKGDPENIENLRPISLLNVDYKIAARALAARLQLVLPNIISHDQQGFIKNRFIGNNIRQIQDMIDYAEDTHTQGAIVFLDFRKALTRSSGISFLKHYHFWV